MNVKLKYICLWGNQVEGYDIFLDIICIKFEIFLA